MKESHIRVTYDHEYVLVVVVTIPSSFPLSWLNTRYLTTVAPKNATRVAETACRSGTHKVTPDLYWGSICSFCRFQSSTLSTVVCPFVLFLLTVVSCALYWISMSSRQQLLCEVIACNTWTWMEKLIDKWSNCKLSMSFIFNYLLIYKPQHEMKWRCLIST